MSYDPTMEPTILDEIRYVVEDIVSNIGGSTYLRTTGKLELELSEHIEMVVSSGDSPSTVPTREQVLFCMVEKLLQIGEFTTNQDLEEMNKYYNNKGEK